MVRAKLVTFLATILTVIAMPSGLAFGQGYSGALSGVVRDANGGVVPGVSVTAKHTDSGLTRAVLTNETGNYNISALPVGSYEVTAELSGFKQVVQRGITVGIGQQAVVDLTLQVGDIRDQITVTEEAQIVNTTMSSTSGLIRNEQIKDLPLNGRSFLDLLTLNAGSVNNRSNTSNGDNPSFSVGGTRPDQTRFTINCADYVGSNTSRVYSAPQGMSGYLLGVDGVQEFNVLGYTYGAEFGKRSGAQVNIVTKSGTNTWHGAGFEYLRNSALNTRNYFDVANAPNPTPVAPFQRNQFGGALGGPILKDKMFVFGNYEGFRERLGITNFGFVPSLQARQGFLPDAAGVYQQVPNLQPGMLKFFALWPDPTGPELIQNGLPTGLAVYAANPKRPIDENYELGRFDYYISSKDSISQNFTIDKGTRSDPATPGFLNDQTADLYTSSTQHTHIFSPTLLNVVTVGWSRAYATSATPPITPVAENLLFVKGKGLPNPGNISITGSGLGTGGGNLASGERKNFTITNDVKLTKGIHNLSFGGDFIRYQSEAFSGVTTNAGRVTYPSLTTFLQDQPQQFQVLSAAIPVNYGARAGAVYFQDEMKLRPNLTIRLGLRDEMTTKVFEKNNNSANYLFEPDGFTLKTQTFTGRTPLLNNNGKALLQPRVGLVWDPSGVGKWAVRAAFGIHNDLIQDTVIQRLKTNPPYTGLVSFLNTPLLSIIPVSSELAAPPQCTATGIPPNCVLYSPQPIDPDLHYPTVQQWSLTIERQLAQGLKLEAGYVGSQSYHIPQTTDGNTIPPQTCNNPAGCLAGGVLAASLRTTVPQGTRYVPVQARPNPLLGQGQSWYYFGAANYHAMNLSLIQRATHGLTFKTTYTFSKGLDTMSGVTTGAATNEPAGILSRFDRAMGKGPTSYIFAHQFATNFSYRLPFGSGRAFGSGATGFVEKLIGGWQWNAIVSATSGFPMAPIIGSNRSGDGNGRNPDVPNVNPNYQGNPVLGVEGFKKTGRYLDPNGFALPTPGTFGNAGRDQYMGPGYFNVDTSLFKRIALKERLNLQFRAEIFNVMNHANFASPNKNIFSGTAVNPLAGTITSTTGGSGNGRQIQFAVRVEF